MRGTAVELDGRTVIYDERTGRVHVLNETATAIWRALDSGGDRDSVVAELAATFDVSAEQVRRDVERLVSELDDLGLLDISSRREMRRR